MERQTKPYRAGMPVCARSTALAQPGHLANHSGEFAAVVTKRKFERWTKKKKFRSFRAWPVERTGCESPIGNFELWAILLGVRKGAGRVQRGRRNPSESHLADRCGFELDGTGTDTHEPRAHRPVSAPFCRPLSLFIRNSSALSVSVPYIRIHRSTAGPASRRGDVCFLSAGFLRRDRAVSPCGSHEPVLARRGPASAELRPHQKKNYLTDANLINVYSIEKISI